jgi:hypothetical protein
MGRENKSEFPPMRGEENWHWGLVIGVNGSKVSGAVVGNAAKIGLERDVGAVEKEWVMSGVSLRRKKRSGLWKQRAIWEVERGGVGRRRIGWGQGVSERKNACKKEGVDGEERERIGDRGEKGLRNMSRVDSKSDIIQRITQVGSAPHFYCLRTTDVSSQEKFV